MQSAIAIGERVILRDRLPSDLACHLRWMVSGEWRAYDAPWEREPDAGEEYRARFLLSCDELKEAPRKRATITTHAGTPIGWVNRYGDPRFPKACCLGIDICEDDYLDRGLGTEALGLWVGHLFAHSDLHRLEIATWSFNARMARVATKLGFTFEGAEREVIEWKGQWIDRQHYSLLRPEWERRASLPPPKP